MKTRRASQTPDARREPPIPDTRDWMTRMDVVQATGVGLSTIPALERRGQLHPRLAYRRDSRGAERSTVVYDPAEVAKLPRRGRPSVDRSQGEITARAFELFREGGTDEDAVIELRETIDHVQYLREKWMEATAASWVISAVAREALAKLVGPFNSVTDLVTTLQMMLKPEPAKPRDV